MSETGLICEHCGAVIDGKETGYIRICDNCFLRERLREIESRFWIEMTRSELNDATDRA